MNNYYSVLVQVCISESPPKTLLSITRITGYSRLICGRAKRGLWPKEIKKSKYAQMHGSSTQYEATVRMQVKLSLDYKRTNPSHSHLGSAGCVFHRVRPMHYSIRVCLGMEYLLVCLNMYRPHRTCLYLGKWIDLLTSTDIGLPAVQSTCTVHSYDRCKYP